MYSANVLRERVSLLTLTEESGGYRWDEERVIWAGVELTGKTNLFSKVGIGATDAALIVRKRELSLFQAMRWKGQHLFLTEIIEPERGWMAVKAAAVTVRTFSTGKDRVSFPGVLTEKYVGYQTVQAQGHAVSTVTYVLVTPKAVELGVGALVDLAEGDGAGRYNVTARHVLDPYKNEYEMTWTKSA